MLKPQVGDTVIIEGVVNHISGNNLYVVTPDEPSCLCVAEQRVKTIIPKPWEPKVGDTVRVKNWLSLYELFHTGPSWSVVRQVGASEQTAPNIVLTKFLTPGSA